MGVRDNERRALGLLMLECLIRYVSCAMMDGAGCVTGASDRVNMLVVHIMHVGADGRGVVE